jgi:tRNA splicing endonuclease
MLTYGERVERDRQRLMYQQDKLRQRKRDQHWLRLIESLDRSKHETFLVEQSKNKPTE